MQEFCPEVSKDEKFNAFNFSWMPFIKQSSHLNFGVNTVEGFK